ncbi:hypothetical protein [Polyangium mundeleinium]|uniref:DUF304 domain-containing protein n=1 Tax=Polyangium mundeleinium TaxID=2995306 RepID=A0ABT5F3E5_9BACT|nr:hypothetical protein [Polyangium mundeleinium]MDC0748610.1 hypothetical protein [Polyangium mundeleinium]
MTDAPTPLTEEERALVSMQLASRRSVANRFAIIAAIPSTLFVLKVVLDGMGRGSKGAALFGLAIAFVIVVGLLVWTFGYRLVALISADLAAGEKRRITGKIERITSEGNAYGETITYVTVGGERFVTRGRFFDRCRGGEAVALDVLPRSRVALTGRVLEAEETR